MCRYLCNLEGGIWFCGIEVISGCELGNNSVWN